VSISVRGRMHLNTIRSMLNQALRDNAALGQKMSVLKRVLVFWEPDH